MVAVPLNSMLPLPTGDRRDQGALLSRILKAIRRKRGLLASEVADHMGMKLRTYELFEAGGGKLNLIRLQKFADATDSDAYAIVMGLAFGDARFALRCADSKLMTISIMSIQDLNLEVGDDVEKLDARVIMHEFDAACGRLADEARRRRLPRSEDPEPSA